MEAGTSLRPWFTHRRMVPKWIAAAVYLAVAALFWTPWAPLAVLVGFLLFSFNEYAIHRWVYHRFAVQPDAPASARSHLRHHLDPTDLDYIFNPPRFSLPLQAAYFLLVSLVFWDLGMGGAVMAGATAAMLYYEYVHFTTHRPGIQPWMPWNRRLKRMHLWHHYKHEDHWFGVTTSVFDRAFGSYRRPDDVDKSDTVRTLVPPPDAVPGSHRDQD